MIHKTAFIAALVVSLAGCSKNEAEIPHDEAETQPSTEKLDSNTPTDSTDKLDSKTPFKTLLAKANDSDLVNGTFVKIGNRYGHWVDASQYTAEERVVMLVWHSAGIIDNGGFEYIFSGDFDGDPDFTITAEAYKTAGLTRGYEAFQDAFKLFPNGKVPHESEERIQQYRIADESVRKQINTNHWKDGWEDLREKKLAQYIRDNASKLGDLDAAQ